MSSTDDFEIEFRWKEEVIYWEGDRGVFFAGGWGVDPPVTHVPDADAWDRLVPAWLRGRHADVVARLRADPRHVVCEYPLSSAVATGCEEVTR